MPSNKKKSAVDKKKKQQGRLAKQNAAQDFQSTVSEFRELLLSGRKMYAKGRAYDAVELQTQALALGSKQMHRFDEDSLVKAHALMELMLAKSAIMTDFATGEEWAKSKEEVREISANALKIFENRIASRTLTKFRKEECWIDASAGEYMSPVSHTERLGPVDYLQCVTMVGLEEPTPDTVRSFKVAMDFVKMFKANGHVIVLESGGALEGALPGGELKKLTASLRQHEAVVMGQKSRSDAMDSLFASDDREETRHTGSLDGKMKPTHKKLAKDSDKNAYKRCEKTNCDKFESQPKQFLICSRCKWAAYCGRDCQKSDWKRHKKECKSGEAATKAKEAEMQNKAKSCLMVGQSQKILTIVSFLHHFAATSEELKRTSTRDAACVLLMITSKFNDFQLGTIQLGVQDTALIWNAIWSMERKQRDKMFRKFVEKMSEFTFPKGGPEFDVVVDWGPHGVHGTFAIVKHTKKGTVMLHIDPEADDDVKGYLAVGITQSIESLLASISDPLPIYVNTALIPFKKMVLCQGTIDLARGIVSNKLQATASDFVRGDREQLKIIESLV